MVYIVLYNERSCETVIVFKFIERFQCDKEFLVQKKIFQLTNYYIQTIKLVSELKLIYLKVITSGVFFPKKSFPPLPF